MKIVYLIIISFFLTAVILPGKPPQKQEKSSQDRLTYEVSVDAHLLPVFAVDKQGNPVYDLKKEDIRLYADNKPVEIIFFTTYRLEGQTTAQEKQPVSTVQAPLKPPERIVFLIIDDIISGLETIKPARTISMGIINNASPGDAFIILRSNPRTGLKYIIGPEKDKKELAKALAKLEKKSIMSRRRQLRRVIKEARLTVEHIPDQLKNEYEKSKSILTQMAEKRARLELKQYQDDVSTYARALQNLKYALKTITLPKTVFLVSASPMEFALGELPITYYRFLEDAAKEINYGGSLFYVINPIPHKSVQQRTKMKFMTDAVDSKCIHGRNLREIANNVKKNTAAYYEIAFYPGKKAGSKSRIRLECKRNDVELTTIGFSEKGIPYRQMNKKEKQMFALNIINGGSWSRMIGKVGKIKFKKIKNQTNTIQVKIPPAMRNRELDLFLVHIDPNTQLAKFSLEKKVMDAKANILVPVMPNRIAYFVIIEPQTTICIYNQVI